MKMTTTNKIQIPDRVFFRIGDVADLLGVKPYVLRYWESEFPMINPQKSPSGQRVYRRSDVETVVMIKRLLYDEKYSVEGAKKRIKELRKEGDLQEFKEEAVSATPSDGKEASKSEKFHEEAPSARRLKCVAAAQELRDCLKKEITELFLY